MSVRRRVRSTLCAVSAAAESRRGQARAGHGRRTGGGRQSRWPTAPDTHPMRGMMCQADGRRDTRLGCWLRPMRVHACERRNDATLVTGACRLPASRVPTRFVPAGYRRGGEERTTTPRTLTGHSVLLPGAAGVLLVEGEARGHHGRERQGGCRRGSRPRNKCRKRTRRSSRWRHEGPAWLPPGIDVCVGSGQAGFGGGGGSRGAHSGVLHPVWSFVVSQRQNSRRTRAAT